MERQALYYLPHLPTGAIDVSTKFYLGQGIYPIEKGLQKNSNYACRVINKKGEVIIPLDKWLVFKSKREVKQKEDFNRGDYLPLSIGEYIIQLVKIENETSCHCRGKRFFNHTL